MEDKSYLDELIQYMQDAQKQRTEEREVLADVPQMGMPFTKKLKAENPNIPESDINDYRSNVKDDSMNYIMGAAGPQQGFQNVVPKLAKSAMGVLPRFKNLLGVSENSMGDKIINTLSSPIKSIRDNADIEQIKTLKAFKEASKDGPRLISEEQLVNSYKPDVDEFTRAKIKKNTDLGIQEFMQEQDRLARLKALEEFGASKESLAETVALPKKSK